MARPLHRVRLAHLIGILFTASILALLVPVGRIVGYRSNANVKSGSQVTNANAREQAASTAAQPFRARSRKMQTSTRFRKSDFSNPAFKGVRVGPNEIDYVADDVTVRKFVPEAPPLKRVTGNYEVEVADDVTIRYFVRKPSSIAETRPVTVETRQIGSRSPK